MTKMTIKEQLKNSLNEAKSDLWMIYSKKSGTTYFVCAASLDNAKNLVSKPDGAEPDDLIGWYMNKLVKSKDSSRIIMDTNMMQSEGDKKY